MIGTHVLSIQLVTQKSDKESEIGEGVPDNVFEAEEGVPDKVFETSGGVSDEESKTREENKMQLPTATRNRISH